MYDRRFPNTKHREPTKQPTCMEPIVCAKKRSLTTSEAKNAKHRECHYIPSVWFALYGSNSFSQRSRGIKEARNFGLNAQRPLPENLPIPYSTARPSRTHATNRLTNVTSLLLPPTSKTIGTLSRMGAFQSRRQPKTNDTNLSLGVQPSDHTTVPAFPRPTPNALALDLSQHANPVERGTISSSLPSPMWKPTSSSSRQRKKEKFVGFIWAFE